MTLEIAHIEALSEALEILLPVEISFWVLLKSILMDLRFCSATIALLLVKILDIAIPYLAAFTFEPL
jgi:flagellar hook protein FlgE